MNLLHLQHAGRPIAFRHLLPFPVPHFDVDRSLSHSLHLIAYAGLIPIYGGVKRHVPDVFPGRRIKLYRSGDSAVVKEIKVGGVFRFRPFPREHPASQHAASSFASHRQRRVINTVVHRNGQKILAVGQILIDLSLKGKKAAFMLAHQFSVKIHLTHMGHSRHAQHQALASHIGRNQQLSLIKYPSIVVPKIHPVF